MCSLFVHLLLSLSTSAQAKPGNKSTLESGLVETGPTGLVATAQKQKESVQKEDLHPPKQISWVFNELNLRQRETPKASHSQSIS